MKPNNRAVQSLPLQDLAIFAAVAETEGFTTAAKRLGVSKAWHLPELNIHAVTTARDYLPRKTQVFIEFFRKRLGTPPYWEQGLTNSNPTANRGASSPS